MDSAIQAPGSGTAPGGAPTSRLRRWLVVYLAAAAAVLSFDALRAQALASGAVHHQALAALWAAVIDGMAAAGVLGVRSDRRDWRAWAMLLLAFAASVAFQVVAPPAWLARAVPPVALLLAIVVLELPRRARAQQVHEAGQEAPPADVAEQARPARVRTYRPLDARERARVRAGLDRKLSGAAIARDLQVNPQRVRAYVRELELAATNGQVPKEGGTPS